MAVILMLVFKVILVNIAVKMSCFLASINLLAWGNICYTCTQIEAITFSAWHSRNTYCIATDEKSLDNPLLMVNEEGMIYFHFLKGNRQIQLKPFVDFNQSINIYVVPRSLIGQFLIEI